MLQEKYKSLIDAASAAGVSGLQVKEQDSVLYIDGTASTANIKDSLWALYATLDPTYSAGDLILNISVALGATITKVKVNTESSNLNIRRGPGTDQPIVGKAAHGEIIELVSRTNEQWWLVRTPKGEEGYAYAQYLSAAE